MNRRIHPAAIAIAAAIFGAVAGYQLAQNRGIDARTPAAEDLQRTERQVAALHDEISRSEELVRAARAGSDSLLRSRWTLRTRLLLTHLSPVMPAQMPPGARPRAWSTARITPETKVIWHSAHLLRYDDRLIANLVLERRQHDRLHEQYHALLRAYQAERALMQEHVSRSRQVARKNRRRAVILSAAVATAATLLIVSK